MSTNNYSNLFSYKESYLYNNEAYAYTDCILLKQIGDIPINSNISEILINFVKLKMKLNFENKIYVVPLSIECSSYEHVKNASESDSDFDNEDESDSEDTEDDSDDESDSEDTEDTK